MDNATVLSVSSYGQMHTVVSDTDLTGEEFVMLSVALMKSQGYVISTIERALDSALHQVRDEIRVIKKV